MKLTQSPARALLAQQPTLRMWNSNARASSQHVIAHNQGESGQAIVELSLAIIMVDREHMVNGRLAAPKTRCRAFVTRGRDWWSSVLGSRVTVSDHF